MGVNALDAAVQGCECFRPISSICTYLFFSDTAVSMLRQQLEPTMRVHGIILGSEKWVTNIIPSCELWVIEAVANSHRLKSVIWHPCFGY